MPVIETKNLTFTYGAGTPFGKTAINDISISIERGEFIGLIGHTGSGKSTFIQTLNGLLRPTSGKVLLNGRDIWAEPKKIRAVRFKVGMVFQYPENQLFEDTVLKDICFGPGNMGLSAGEAEKRALKAAKAVGLTDDMLPKSPFELSGGEKRRAAIAGVMAMDPDVLILDEPTAGLDPNGRDMLLKQLSDYHRVRRNTVILVSHSMEDIAKAADRVLVMDSGKAVMFDKTEKVFANGGELQKIGLRVPQITEITLRLRKDGYNIRPALTVEQAVRELLPVMKKRRAENG